MISAEIYQVSTVNWGHLFNRCLLTAYYVPKAMFCQQSKMSKTKEEETLGKKME
jgi:predicted transporter